VAGNAHRPGNRGSPDVSVNGQKVLRIGDPGVHSACCGPNTWNCAAGSATVFVNGIPVVRLGDATAILFPQGGLYGILV
jgi:uncharacterized Zn-binding protein involved in type VI secretion